MISYEGIGGYEDVESTSSRIENVENVSLEGLSTVENLSLENIDYLKSIEGLQYEAFKNDTIEGRQKSLQTLEKRLAEIEGRPPVKIVFMELGKDSCGFYSDSERCMYINSEHVKDPRYRLEVIDTVAHEGQHALQHFAVEHPEQFPQYKEVIPYWRANSAAYIPPEIAKFLGYEYYYNQPKELNAWERGPQISALFKNKFETFDNMLESAFSRVETDHAESYLGKAINTVKTCADRLIGAFSGMSDVQFRQMLRAGAMTLAHHHGFH